MKLLLRIFFAALCLHSQFFAHAQCTNVMLNWDYLDYFTYSGNYDNGAYLTNVSQAQTQYFAFGTQRLTISNNFTAATILGENTLHTGEGNSYGAGADINFNGNGSITMTFENEVTNVKFSIYDLDNSQNVTVTANKGDGSSAAILLSEANNTNAISINAGTATSNSTSRNTTSTQATVNVDIAGPVKVIKLVFGGTAGDFWISDINACSIGNFPLNYYQVSKPFISQPGYVLHAFDTSVYAVNPANGVTKFLFSDPSHPGAGPGNINSMAYDPYDRILYYVYSLTALSNGTTGSSTMGNSRILMKYDFNTNKKNVVLADLNSIGIPTVNPNGAESGAAAFYNGELYIGIETQSSDRKSGREAVIWRIDFDGAGVPYRSSQVFAVPNDDGNGNLLHDWSDFVINNGVLYDFDGAGAKTADVETDIIEFNLITGAAVNFPKPTGFIPGQPAIDWEGKIYNLFATTLTPNEDPYIAPYNAGFGTINTTKKYLLTSTPAFKPIIPSIGDAAEGFRPKADFGDAPSTFDPNPSAPAVHEISTNLRLGSTVNDEWNKTNSTNADADTDDALPFVQILNTGSGTYQAELTYHNNTGKTATIAAWVDFNNNGTFDSNEGITLAAPSSTSTQASTLQWTNITTALPSLTKVYMRIRITTSAMTTTNATGYFSDGEVEDYLVPVNYSALPLQLTDFCAKKLDEQHILVKWTVSEEEIGTIYEVQKSKDGRKWKTVDIQKGSGVNYNEYSYSDANPEKPASYFRLKYTEPGNSIHYSEVKKLDFIDDLKVKLFPNPASNLLTLWINAEKEVSAKISIYSRDGKKVFENSVLLNEGANSINLGQFIITNAPGLYTLKLVREGIETYHKIEINRN